VRIRIVVAAVVVIGVTGAVLGAAPAALKAAHLHWPSWPFVLAAAMITAVAGLAAPVTTVVTSYWANRVQGIISRRDQSVKFERAVAGGDHGLPEVTQITDRRVLGIHPAIPLPADADPILSADLPLYVTRDIDPDLRAWVKAHENTGGFLLLAGSAAAGKTRTAFQLIQDALGDWPLLIPASAQQLTGYLDTIQTSRKLVVWLNETQNYLGPGGLTAATVRRLLAAPRPVIIIGTIWPDRYDAMTASPSEPRAGSGAEVPLADVYADAREILVILADRRNLAARFSPAERDRAAALAHRDPRLAEALADPDNHRIPETLAAGSQLISRWLVPANPHGAAVITAAIAARRCGHPEPVPADVLRPLAEQAMTPAERATAARSWFPPALAWAREPVRGQAAPLTPQASTPALVDGDNVSDILTQHAERDTTVPWHQIPEAAWQQLIKHASPAACQSIAAAAYPHRAAHQLPVAQNAARKAADAGYPAAMTSLAVLLDEQGHADQARYWYRRAAMAGDTSAMYSLAFLLAESGNEDQARQWYQQAADAGHFGAMSNLAALLRQQGDDDQAQHWHRKASVRGQITRATRTTAPPPDDPELTEQLTNKAKQGNASAMCGLGWLHAQKGQYHQAEQWYLKAVEHGDTGAMFSLGSLHARQRYLGKAEHWYRRAADAGDGRAMNQLAIMLAEQGQPDQAARWYRKAAETGGGVAAGAMYNLAQLLNQQQQADQAEYWYRKSAALGHTAAMLELGNLLHRQGYARQASQWYRKSAAAGDPDAMRKIADLLTAQGNPEQAKRWYDQANHASAD
jgi:TPR repeat protein